MPVAPTTTIRGDRGRADDIEIDRFAARSMKLKPVAQAMVSPCLSKCRASKPWERKKTEVSPALS